ncbi:MAG: hypothetical protein KA914_01470 [Ottowia sp.]|jgi:uncharacterized membrane protein|nr:hypothetical protein [Ottowia sp.]
MSKDIIDVEARRPGGDARNDSLKTWGWVSYILHLIVAVGAVVPGAQISPVLLVIALVFDLVKKDDAIGSWQESHFKWRIGSVLWAAFWYVITIPVAIPFLFLWNPAWVVVSIWFLYRIVKGMVRMNASRPIDG